LSFWLRNARSLERSSISLPSNLPFAFNLTNSASATLVRDWSCPLDRKASANSTLICAVPSFSVFGIVGSFDLGSEVFAAFLASRAAVRSRRFVTVVC
jgi:hypothetical protein